MPSLSCPFSAAMLDTMTTDPSRRSAICGNTRLHNHRLCFTLVFITLSYASSVTVAIGPKCGLTAALQTSTSIRRQCAIVWSTSPRTWSRCDM